jgi:hypothetical protein
MSRWKVAAACAVAFAVAMWLTFFRASEEDRIRETLDRFTRAVAVKPDDNVLSRSGRLASELKETVTDQVRVEVPDVGVRVSSRKDLVEAATKAGLVYGSADAALTNVRIRIEEGASTAKADALVVVTAERGGERKVDRRDVHFLLFKDDGWKITTIDVAGRSEPD